MATTELAAIDDTLMLSIARSLAMDLEETETILAAHGVTSAQYERMARTARYKDVFKQYVIDWNKPSTIPERVKIKSQMLVELNLDTMHREINNAKEPLSSRVEAFKTVAKLGEVDGARRSDQAPGSTFSVTINLGADQQMKVVAPMPTLIDAEDR